jgi:phosphoglycerate kinase
MSSLLTGVKTLKDFDFKDKRVFLRLDLNVPIKKGKITDETRINGALPTLKYLLEGGAKLIVASHLGRPKGPDDRENNSLEPVGARLAQVLGIEIDLIENPNSDAPKALLIGPRKNKIILLENLRFDPGEEKNSIELAKSWAEYTDIYVNDAFGASHRAHASIVGLPELVKDKCAGFLMEKELAVLGQLLDGPPQPYVAILGGVKVSDKIGVIENLIDRVDSFVIGGAMAYTFLEAEGLSIGKSRVETDKIKFAKELIARVESRNKKIHLPVDHVIADSFDNPKQIKVTSDANIPDGFMGLDIGPKSLAQFRKVLGNAKTVLWNGPMGVFEKPEFAKGSFGLAEFLAGASAKTIVGGGDSAAAVNASGFGEKMAHISTGGGASLELLQGDKLPGIDALRMRKQSAVLENL